MALKSLIEECEQLTKIIKAQKIDRIIKEHEIQLKAFQGEVKSRIEKSLETEITPEILKENKQYFIEAMKKLNQLDILERKYPHLSKEAVWLEFKEIILREVIRLLKSPEELKLSIKKSAHLASVNQTQSIIKEKAESEKEKILNSCKMIVNAQLPSKPELTSNNSKLKDFYFQRIKTHLFYYKTFCQYASQTPSEQIDSNPIIEKHQEALNSFKIAKELIQELTPAQQKQFASELEECQKLTQIIKAHKAQKINKIIQDIQAQRQSLQREVERRIEHEEEWKTEFPDEVLQENENYFRQIIEQLDWLNSLQDRYRRLSNETILEEFKKELLVEAERLTKSKEELEKLCLNLIEQNHSSEENILSIQAA